jgi:hypothetical protein
MGPKLLAPWACAQLIPDAEAENAAEEKLVEL